jgi:hypothetical protein
MKLDTGGYVSWWPSGGVDAKNPSTKDAISQGISDDKREEGSLPDYASPPIKGLDEAAMDTHWRRLSGRLSNEDHVTSQSLRPVASGGYDLFSNSCAGVVLDVLVAGRMYWKYPVTRAMVGNNVIITPMLIKDLAEMMAGELSNKVLSFITNAGPWPTSAHRIRQYFVRP